jgi:hypothetical protein
MWQSSISLLGKAFDLAFTPPFSGNGFRASFSGVGELSTLRR